MCKLKISDYGFTGAVSNAVPKLYRWTCIKPRTTSIVR